jgi:hypothetical protein
MRNKVIFYLLCMLVLPGAAWSQTATLQVAPFSIAAQPGTPMQMDVQVSTTEQIGALQFTVEYNSSVMTFSDVVRGADLPNGFAITNIIHNLQGGTTSPDTDSNVLVQILGSGVNWFTGDSQSVATFTFNVSPTACGTSVIVFDPACQRTHLSTAQLQTICNPNLVSGELVSDNCPTDAAPPPSGTLRLMQNRPNPFNPSTVIPFELSVTGHVSLRVFDLSGRLVRTLLDRVVEDGAHQVPWDGRDAAAQELPTGVYFYKLSTRDADITKRSVLLK